MPDWLPALVSLACAAAVWLAVVYHIGWKNGYNEAKRIWRGRP